MLFSLNYALQQTFNPSRSAIRLLPECSYSQDRAQLKIKLCLKVFSCYYLTTQHHLTQF